VGQDYSLAAAHVAALTGADPATAVVDLRLIHDQRKDVPAHPLRGTLAELWSTVITYNSAGYGAFINISELDGAGRETSNVVAERCAVVDLDKVDAEQQLSRIEAWNPAPTFTVNSSPGKHHVYWCGPRYKDDAWFTDLQRRLLTEFNGDNKVIDPARVLRLAGTFHNKAEPFLVTCRAMAGYGRPADLAALRASVAHVTVQDGGTGERHALGDPDLAAPSLHWLQQALDLSDPNKMDRGEWVAFNHAFKQAGWTLADDATLFAMWSKWCERYDKNDTGENNKEWRSIRQTQLGWKSLVARVPSLKPQMAFSDTQLSAPSSTPGPTVPPMPSNEPPPLDCSGEMLTHVEQAEWFKGCVLIERSGEILTPSGRYMNATRFNAKYGGKKFIVDGQGKATDEPWKAATRGSVFKVPQVDHVRFLPELPFGTVVEDELRRKGVNTYIPIVLNAKQGDVTPWLRHMEYMLPVETDRQIIFEFLAHNVKYPGVKIPWAPMIQSAEGVGKGFIKECMEQILGTMYSYSPKAPELVKSGSTFNAWMSNRLMIIVDEIKVDERRELIEILKPMISDKRIEVQKKGIDQEMEDNVANWFFFSNYKDAIPVSANGRRYAIFYSAIQSAADLMVRQMGDDYFRRLWYWRDYQGGLAAIAHWLLSYPIERGAIAMRAPATSSSDEARKLTRSPVERILAEAVDDALPGFRGGWISSLAAAKRLREAGGPRVSASVVEAVIAGMGYASIGRASRSYAAEDLHNRTHLFNLDPRADVSHFGAWQDYGA
jgi:hypothetical protein